MIKEVKITTLKCPDTRSMPYIQFYNLVVNEKLRHKCNNKYEIKTNILPKEEWWIGESWELLGLKSSGESSFVTFM